MDTKVDSNFQIENHTSTILLPENDRKLKNAYHVYKPSFYSLNFLSEEGRLIYAESIRCVDDSIIFVPSLRHLAISTFYKHYKGGKIDNRIKFVDYIEFGLNCNIELPLIDIIALDVSIVL